MTSNHLIQFMRSRALARFLRYLSVDTGADPEDLTPASKAG
mgnify:FL=1